MNVHNMCIWNFQITRYVQISIIINYLHFFINYTCESRKICGVLRAFWLCCSCDYLINRKFCKMCVALNTFCFLTLLFQTFVVPSQIRPDNIATVLKSSSKVFHFLSCLKKTWIHYRLSLWRLTTTIVVVPHR